MSSSATIAARLAAVVAGAAQPCAEGRRPCRLRVLETLLHGGPMAGAGGRSALDQQEREGDTMLVGPEDTRRHAQHRNDKAGRPNATAAAAMLCPL